LICILQYAGKEFGTCPLVQCGGQPVLPVGIKDEVGAHTVKIYCPKCQCIYHPPPVRSRTNHHGNAGSGGSIGVDGASFGTTFPHLFLMTFSNLVPDPLPVDSAYIPRVFGFRIHSSARQVLSSSSTTMTPSVVMVDASGQPPVHVEEEASRDSRLRSMDPDDSASLPTTVALMSSKPDADNVTRSLLSRNSNPKRTNRTIVGEDDKNGDSNENGEGTMNKRRKRTEIEP
jgi:Casein kinase II regulatory subunit